MAHICDKCAQESYISITSSESEEYYSPTTPKQKPKLSSSMLLYV